MKADRFSTSISVFSLDLQGKVEFWESSKKSSNILRLEVNDNWQKLIINTN